MFGTLDISASALVAQRTRLEVISANMANRDAIEDANGNYAPFRRRIAIFAPGDPDSGKREGVHISDIMFDMSPLRAKLEPGHKHADADGMVYYPNIDPAMEMVNALEAARAYEANITAAEATKSMIQSALRLMA